MNVKRCSNIVLIASAAGACIATFFGLRAMMSGGLEGAVVPVVMAAVVAVTLGMLWHFVLHIVPQTSSTGLRIAGLSAAGALGTVAIAISSWFVTTAIGGRDAIRIDNAEQIDTYRDVLDIAASNPLAELQIVPDLSRMAADMAALADSEEQRGQLSGRPGKGPVVDTLRRASGTYASVVKEAETMRDRLSILRTAANNELKAMDNLVNGNWSVAESQRRFATAVGNFRQKITEIDQLSILPTARRLAVVVVPASNVGAGQGQALTNIQAALAERSEELNRKVEAVAAVRKELPPISNRPINPGWAVIKHADKVFAAWCVGVGIDLLPLLLLVVLVIASLEEAAREQTERSAPQQRPGDTADGGRRPQLVAGE